MNINDYISSGIVQAYVMDQINAADRQEFDRLSAQYPELVAAREAFEKNLERFAHEHAVVPPRQVKDGFLEVIQHPSINQPNVNNTQQE